MNKYQIGQLLIFVPKAGFQHSPESLLRAGMECIVIDVHLEGEKHKGFGTTYTVDFGEFDDMVWEIAERNLQPMDDGEANTVTSWEDCPFKPSRQEIPA